MRHQLEEAEDDFDLLKDPKDPKESWFKFKKADPKDPKESWFKGKKADLIAAVAGIVLLLLLSGLLLLMYVNKMGDIQYWDDAKAVSSTLFFSPAPENKHIRNAH